MITNLLEALLKENSNQFSEVFEELIAEKLTVKVEETLQEHFEASEKARAANMNAEYMSKVAE